MIAPWVVRNQLRYGPTVLLENQLAYNLWVAHDPAPSLEIYEEWRRLPDPVTRSRAGFERGAAAIAADPAGFASSVPGRAVNLWGLEFFVVRHLIFGAYGEVSRGAFLAAFWLIQLGWAGLLLCAAPGLPALWRARELRPVLVYAVALTLLVSCMLVSTRFRVPFGVPLCVAAGLGAPLVARARLSWREWTALAAALGILAVSCSRPVFRRIAGAEFASPAELWNSDWMQHRY